MASIIKSSKTSMAPVILQTGNRERELLDKKLSSNSARTIFLEILASGMLVAGSVMMSIPEATDEIFYTGMGLFFGTFIPPIVSKTLLLSPSTPKPKSIPPSNIPIKKGSTLLKQTKS